MVYKSATLKSASMALDKVLPRSYRSHAQIELIASDSHVKLVSLMFDREPVEIAKKFLFYRLQNKGG